MTKKLLIALVLCSSFVTLYANAGDIRFKTLANKNVSLNQMINDGKYTLVMIWSTDCVACEEQKPMIEAFHKDYSKTTAKVIGVANDGMGLLHEIKQLINKNEPSYPNYVALPETFFSEFEIVTGKKFRATPTYIMFDRNGRIMGVAVGQITREKLDQIVAK